MDINMLREISNFQGIPLCDTRMTFFYDETGNCGKFSLCDEGVNDPTALSNDFILGGVAYIGEENPSKPEELIRALRLQSNELKLKNIYRSGSFLEAMGSRRASIYIDWLYNSGLYVHYSTINNLYYALVDMVDSLWESQPQFAFSFEWVLQLKSALYEFCREHEEEVLSLMYRYHYPNIEQNEIQNFGWDFCNLIQTYNDQTTYEGFLVENFRQMLKYASRQGKLSFLQDNESDVLVEEYYTLYQARCYNFKYSFHHFDYEKVILNKMQESPLTENDAPFVNYDFNDSIKDTMIQICDVFVGILANIFSLLDSMTVEEIEEIRIEENKKAIENIRKISLLIDKSDAFHKMMIHNVNDVKLARERITKLLVLVRHFE